MRRSGTAKTVKFCFRRNDAFDVDCHISIQSYFVKNEANEIILVSFDSLIDALSNDICFSGMANL